MCHAPLHRHCRSFLFTDCLTIPACVTYRFHKDVNKLNGRHTVSPQMATGALREFICRRNIQQARRRLNRKDGFVSFFDAAVIEETVMLARLLDMTSPYVGFPVTADFEDSHERFGVMTSEMHSNVAADHDDENTAEEREALALDDDDESDDDAADADTDEDDESDGLARLSHSQRWLVGQEGLSGLAVQGFDALQNRRECAEFETMQRQNAFGLNPFGAKNWEAFAAHWNAMARVKAREARAHGTQIFMFLKTPSQLKSYDEILKKREEKKAARAARPADWNAMVDTTRVGVASIASLTAMPATDMLAPRTMSSTDLTFKHAASVPPLSMISAPMPIASSSTAPSSTAASASVSATSASSVDVPSINATATSASTTVVMVHARAGVEGPSAHFLPNPPEYQFKSDQHALLKLKRRPRRCTKCGHISLYGTYKQFHDPMDEHQCKVQHERWAKAHERYSACQCTDCTELLAPLEEKKHFGTARIRRARDSDIPKGVRTSTFQRRALAARPTFAPCRTRHTASPPLSPSAPSHGALSQLAAGLRRTSLGASPRIQISTPKSPCITESVLARSRSGSQR
jgi:hypothetical protein